MPLVIKKALISKTPEDIQAWIDGTAVAQFLGMVEIGCSFVLVLYTEPAQEPA